MRRVAVLLAETGVKARITTTTRVGIDEFAGIPVRTASERPGIMRALAEDEPVLLVAAGLIAGQNKYAGIEPGRIDGLRLPADTVLLVEGDGSRRLPMKVPKEWEPVIPGSSRVVLAFMGASAFDEPMDERHIYNHRGALALLGKAGSLLGAKEIAALAAHRDGCRKGVPPDAAFRLVISQGDLEDKRETAREALRIMRERGGIEGALASFQKGELYGTTAD